VISSLRNFVSSYQGRPKGHHHSNNFQFSLSTMFAARRFAASSRRLAAQQPPRRFGSHSAHAEPVNEGIGVSSYPPAADLEVSDELQRTPNCNEPVANM
jgi:hypothetical protein